MHNRPRKRLRHKQSSTCISHQPLSPRLYSVHCRHIGLCCSKTPAICLMSESRSTSAAQNVSTTDGSDALKYKASILQPTNHLCFGSIMNALPTENIHAHRSTTSCLPLLNLAPRSFIQLTVFCYAYAARFRLPPSDPAKTTRSCPITPVHLHHHVSLPRMRRPDLRATDNQMTRHSFSRRHHPPEVQGTLAQVRLLRPRGTLGFLWYFPQPKRTAEEWNTPQTPEVPESPSSANPAPFVVHTIFLYRLF